MACPLFWTNLTTNQMQVWNMDGHTVTVMQTHSVSPG
jgi:hypothetical protein